MAATPPGPPSISQIEAALTGRYHSFSLLGTQGGQGVACKATSADGCAVALKVYDAEHVEERSEREVAALRQLKSPRIIRLHDAGRVVIDGETYRFIATTFVEGTPLSDLLSTGPLSVEKAAQIATDIAEAIDELWRLKIVHRDVKPDNIIVTAETRAVLIDLGIARHLSQRTLTTAGYTYGTMGYYSPEHFAVRPVTCKADVFATGIVFQQVILGRHPTHGRQDLLADGGARTKGLVPSCPDVVAELIDRMVAKRTYDRPEPADVKNVLQAYLHSVRKA
jgi:eukaryotic-like serine/threonine-protein kinase